jgi:hypothetical protein
MKIIYDQKYKKLMIKQIKEQIRYLLESNTEFSIIVHMDSGVDFNPVLPKEISDEFRDFTIFAIGGYTFKSAFIENNTFIFEAGFGRENIGSMVYVDVDRILQILIGDNPIFINVIASLPRKEEKNPFDVFASNPKNKKFFKK